jgi:hypothetical protein
MWEAIKRYAENGYRSMCFGRTAMDNTGLRKFKAGWGADEHIVNYYKYDVRRETFVGERSLVKKSHRCIFRAMPIFLIRVLGSLLYKHVG